MDDGEVEVSDRFLLRLHESPGDFPCPVCGEDSFLDQLLKNTTSCTHTHTCNPPGPYAAVHTHTCYHTHTQLLEEEVQKLRLVNQQLVRKLQRQAILEAEVVRLRSVLVDLRSKIDGELGAFPFQKLCGFATVSREGDCSMQSAGGTFKLHCRTDLRCFHPSTISSYQDCTPGGMKPTAMLSHEGDCLPGDGQIEARAKAKKRFYK